MNQGSHSKGHSEEAAGKFGGRVKTEIREEREDGGKSGSRFWLESKESKTLSLR